MAFSVWLSDTALLDATFGFALFVVFHGFAVVIANAAWSLSHFALALLNFNFSFQ